MTYQNLLQEGYLAMRSAGLEDEVFECKEMLCACSGLGKSGLLRDMTCEVAVEVVEKFRSLLARRLNLEPLAYLLGEWDFYGATFRVNENVLIPRMDTEVLAERGILVAGEFGGPVLDLCAGSGCIGITVAREVTSVSVVLGEISPLAREVCLENIRIHGLGERVVCEEMNCFDVSGGLKRGKYAVILSNPPYINGADMLGLEESVKGFEPHLALFGGEDGLDFYRILCQHWKAVLLPEGRLIMEVGIGQYEDVEALLLEHGFQVMPHSLDSMGIVRVVEGRLL